MTKIEIHLVANSDYTEDALDEASIVLRNVTPTVSMNLADGTIGAAYGTPISITPRKTGKLDYEAIIPPQQKPLDFIEVSLHGTVIKVDAQVTTFDGNTRYPYDLTLTYKDVRKNPLWYVAKYNINYDGSSTYSWATTPDEGYYFSWADAMKAFTTAANAGAATPISISNYYIGTGCKFSGWHMATQAEWWSISPGGDLTNIWTFDSEGTGTYKASNQTVVFGYNFETQKGIPEASYWKKISSTELHALRYLGTDYCSAWKYVWDANYGMTVYATLVGEIENTSAGAASWYAANWNNVYFGNNPSIGAVRRSFGKSGFSGTGSGTTGSSLPASVYHWTTTSQNANDAYVLVFAAGFSYVDSANDRKAYGRRIRLFREIIEPYRFSVAQGRTVEFSPGNLQAYISSGPANTYNYTANNWRFAEHQWDYCNATLAVGNWVDHFGWVGTSASYNTYGLCSNATNNNSYYGTSASDALKTDWGSVPGVISALGSGWRTLTAAEWVYLINTRATGVTVNGTPDARYTEATIRTDGTSVNGIILFPDNYYGGTPSGVTWGAINATSAWGTRCTIAGWNALEVAGCVFLPAAGYRSENALNLVGTRGIYWSSTADIINYAYAIAFGDDGVNPAGGSNRMLGRSVRLVR